MSARADAADRLPLLRHAARARIPLRRRGSYRAPRRSFGARRHGVGPDSSIGRSNPRGMHAERWRHLHGCGRFFNALRDTTNDRFAATYKIGEEHPTLAEPQGARQGSMKHERPFRLDAGGAHRPRHGRCALLSTARLTKASPATRSPPRLLANGVHLVGRSFKYHRPRGIVAAGSDEPNALVAVAAARRASPPICAPPRSSSMTTSGEEPEPLALARSRLRRSQRRLRRRSFPPASTTRRSCGRNRPGSASTSRRSAPWPASGARRPLPDPDTYAQRYAHCDVLVIGGGPAGLAAALAAAAHRRARRSCATSRRSSAARCLPKRKP